MNMSKIRSQGRSKRKHKTPCGVVLFTVFKHVFTNIYSGSPFALVLASPLLQDKHTAKTQFHLPILEKSGQYFLEGVQADYTNIIVPMSLLQL